MDAARSFVDRYHELLRMGDVQGVVALYADDAVIVGASLVAATRDEIEAYHRARLDGNAGYAVRSVDGLRHSHDVLAWDALIDTDAGAIQHTDVMILDPDGRIRRHVPLFEGYWGQ